jgi:hypothetical protein
VVLLGDDVACACGGGGDDDDNVVRTTARLALYLLREATFRCSLGQHELLANRERMARVRRFRLSLSRNKISTHVPTT